MKFCVIGLGRFGYQLAVTLAQEGSEVLAIDKNDSLVESIRDEVTQAICADIKTEETLLAIGIEDIQTVIITIGDDFSQSTLITALLKKCLKVPCVIARAVNEIHETILKLVGADEVISLEKNTAIKLAHKLSSRVGDFVQITDDFATTQIHAPLSFIGKTIRDVINLKIHKVMCVAVRKSGKTMLVTPDYIIMEKDVLLFAGNIKALSCLIHL